MIGNFSYYNPTKLLSRRLSESDEVRRDRDS